MWDECNCAVVWAFFGISIVLIRIFLIISEIEQLSIHLWAILVLFCVSYASVLDREFLAFFSPQFLRTFSVRVLAFYLWCVFQIFSSSLLFFFWLGYGVFGEGSGNPLQYSCLENSMDRGAWGATVHGVEKSQTQLSNWAHMVFLAMQKHFIYHCICILSHT